MIYFYQDTMIFYTLSLDKGYIQSLPLPFSLFSYHTYYTTIY